LPDSVKGIRVYDVTSGSTWVSLHIAFDSLPQLNQLRDSTRLVDPFGAITVTKDAQGRTVIERQITAGVHYQGKHGTLTSLADALTFIATLPSPIKRVTVTSGSLKKTNAQLKWTLDCDMPPRTDTLRIVLADH
jgi:hypothetical protein